MHPDDRKLRLAIAVTLAAESETLAHWARTGGATPLGRQLADALTTIKPVLDTGTQTRTAPTDQSTPADRHQR